MKINKIKLNDYLHFSKGLEIDLTYPNGCGEKSGKPLDKVCFIGQSGTGKTSLLNLIKYFTADKQKLNSDGIDFKQLGQNCVEIHYLVNNEFFCKSPVGAGKDEFIIKKNNANLTGKEFGEIEKLINANPILINFPFNVIPQEVKDSPQIVGGEGQKGVDFDVIEGEFKMGKNKIWDLTSMDIDTIASIVFQKMENYIEVHRRTTGEYYNKAKEATKNNEADQSTYYIQQVIDWERDHPNPIKVIADSFINEILQSIGLEAETDVLKYNHKVDEYKKNSANFFIVNQNGKQIDLKNLSTGTKQIIFTAIPLFFLEPQNSIILFDQPEASLYPNIQLAIPNIYTKIASNSQFFFATHSPIVAAAFEPWEIVELVFEGGLIVRKPYFHGNRECKNYILNPKLLKWNSIYNKCFNVLEEGGSERIKKIEDLAVLEQKIGLEKDQENKRKLVDEYELTASLLDWEI